MVLSDIEKLVAKQLGVNLAQNKADIGKAINGALEEVSNVVDVSEAQKLHTEAIASGKNTIDRPEKNDRILSVRYAYDSNGSTIYKSLTKVQISTLDIVTAGLQNLETDYLSYFAVSGLKIIVGPGIANTGGSLLVRTQRSLKTNDIQYIPNAMMLVHGAVSNYLPATDPKTGLPSVGYERSRARFLRALAPTGLGLQDVREKHSEVLLPDNIIRDDSYRNYLGRGTGTWW